MSKVNPVSRSTSVSSLDQLTQSKQRGKQRKVSRVRLPTPPPDPNLQEDEAKSNKEVLDYLESLQRSQPHPALSRSTSAFAPAIAAEDAFDHLDKLYKLMEQMLTLREQNVLLHRRIMDLERFRNMQDMNRKLDCAEEVPDCDPDSEFAEHYLYNILTETKKDPKAKPPPRFRQSILRKSQRARTQSASEEPQQTERRISIDKQSKVSKWTKVKAAFKWEKASPTVSDAKSQDSGLGSMQPVNYEMARYLRVPSTSEELGTSPADSGAAEISTPGTLSSASSTEDLHHRHHVRRRTQIEDTSDDEPFFTYDIPKEETSTSSGRKTHKTPWEKMKDILQTQTRNSFKKKHRLSAKSDDFKIDLSIGSDNEDVFEDPPKSPRLIVQSPEEISLENEALSLEHNIPIDIIARYQVYTDDNSSKWDKVKKAFLTHTRDDTIPAIRREPNPTKESDEKLHAEIQKNYIELQKKLSQEFQEKLQEWERSKLNSPCASIGSTTPQIPQEETKDLAFKKKMEEWEKIKSQPKHMQLQSEENLPPEFRKKLQEWKKIKKSSIKEDSAGSSGCGAKRKLSDWPKWKSINTTLDAQQLSDDFLKKYESWKQIKAGTTTPTEEMESRGSFKTPSPRLMRKEGSTKKIKEQTGKELQWFEKELGKIEREKQRLERDRQKFLDREERLAKLRRSVGGGNKKEILVHTPSGFYRFEGISRKFTQKLYEWEKAQGIGPEESTFALLKSSCIPDIRGMTSDSSSNLMRSKSADSIMNPEMSTGCPLMSQQPSSLSLNDMENLEKDIIIDDNLYLEEPEALIVEVEDVVEETASFLENYMEKHIPVYQKQETSNMCEGETKAAPTIRRSESARAQANYNLIEEIINLLRGLIDNEKDIEHIEDEKMKTDSIIIINSDDDVDVKTLKEKQTKQRKLSGLLLGKLQMLQEANNSVAVNLAKEDDKNSARLVDVIDTVQDLSSEIYNLAENIDNSIYRRCKNQLESDIINSSAQLYPQICENLGGLNNKILELRRNLSYICAASDMSVASWRKKVERNSLKRVPSVDRKRVILRRSKSKEDSPSELRKQVEQGAIKKRIRYRQKGIHSRTLDESDDDEEEIPRKPNKPRRIRSQNSTESNKSIQETKLETRVEEKELSPVLVDPVVAEKVIVPTKTTNFLNFEEPSQINETQDSPVTLFVKTTRKLFTPIIATQITTPPNTPTTCKKQDSILENQVRNLPPLPASPTPQRKNKEISPNIRLMMVKYNQKIADDVPRSGGSSGSASPVAWRSPVLERRVKAQTEKYQQDLQKMSPLLGGRREVQKSASMGLMVSGNKQVTIHSNMGTPENSPKPTTKGILKSSSTSVIHAKKPETNFTPLPEITEKRNVNLHLNISQSVCELCDERSMKLKKAKEEFLNSPPPSAPVLLRTSPIKYPAKNRLSQISVGSESSCTSSAYEGVLIKSASAGMINIAPDAYKQFDPEVHADGYVSLPRAAKKSKESLLSNITSKFRKVKMRRHKEANRMVAVPTLCRQSLVVDISASQETLNEAQSRLSLPGVDSRGTSSGETSPTSSRTGSWIKKLKPKP
ncbi:PREDICTED: uncharacterized protein LOC108560010 isoform X1 [Nicrophorus vespilloides]|uniref:Uncharacterized protein LOC108560010 isoform X1 n=1 Tax=Nicrophorus vespilloides TaxID=110193 RepID=A0ABM1MEB2_NICVS|nr:PREDICTED: uncharacterized protein LOC108560010 isoform X1 [Nicrophorus vespilloides]